MKIVSLTELKNNFSALMDLVKKGGGTLLVCERDIPVIKVISATDSRSENSDEHSGLLLRLERAGHLVRGEETKKSIPIEDLLVKSKKRVDILQALLADREEGR